MTIALRMGRKFKEFRMTNFLELASPMCMDLYAFPLSKYCNGTNSSTLNLRQ